MKGVIGMLLGAARSPAPGAVEVGQCRLLAPVQVKPELRPRLSERDADALADGVFDRPLGSANRLRGVETLKYAGERLERFGGASLDPAAEAAMRDNSATS